MNSPWPMRISARPLEKRGQAERPQGGFTLIELILVMTMLVILLAVVAPSLSQFFRGRTLDSEAKRFLALTRYGQSRAVSEGVPMFLWIDPTQKEYGLRADSSYLEQDDKLLQYQWDPDLEVEVEQSAMSRKLTSLWKGDPTLGKNMSKIRFGPDGFISESSPERVVFRDRDKSEIWVGENEDRLKYEIETNRVPKVFGR